MKKKRGVTVMKKVLALLLSFLLLSINAVSLAEVIILESPEMHLDESVDLSDIKDGQTVVIDGYGELTFYDDGWNDKYGFYSTPGIFVRYSASNTSEYYVIRVRILNTKREAYNFREDFGDVVCSFGDDYKFGGFVEELSYRYDDYSSEYNMQDGTGLSTEVDSLYQRDYAVIVTLPNVVKERDTEPLSITFTINGDEVTFIVRE